MNTHNTPLDAPRPGGDTVERPRGPDPLGLSETAAYRTTPADAQGKGDTSNAGNDATRPGPWAVQGMVGNYQLLEEIAEGGMGVVYKACHTTMDRLVALKTMRKRAGAEPQLVLRFEREIRVIARLSHPHIVPIYEVGTHQGKLYYAMAYLPGGTLAQQRQRLLDEPYQAVQLLEKVARAVHYAHEQGVLHRDLKPANILLDARGEPQITDFGLAKLLDADLELTQTGDVMGTPAYMSPELALGRLEEVGPASDVWALGVVLFELLTGRKPFVGDSVVDVKQAITTQEPPAPGRLRPGLDGGLEGIVLKCLQKKPTQRYPNVQLFADDLARYLRGERVRETPRPRLASGVFRWVFLGVLLVLAGVGLALLASTFSPSIGPVAPQVETITLINAIGEAENYRFIVGENRAVLTPAKEREAFFLSTPGTVLLQLRQTPPGPNYRLEGEVRHDAGTLDEVGLYFGYQSCHSPTKGDYHSFFRMNFYAPRGSGGLAVRHSFIPHLWPQSVVSNGLFSDRLLPPEDNVPGGWHKLIVEVRPREVRFLQGTHLLGAMVREKMQDTGMALFHQLGDVAWQYAPDGGVGLFLEKGTASFRNVQLTPLP